MMVYYLPLKPGSEALLMGQGGMGGVPTSPPGPWWPALTGPNTGTGDSSADGRRTPAQVHTLWMEPRAGLNGA